MLHYAMKLTLSDLEFTLPPELIANKATEPRDHAKLLVVVRKTQEISHKKFFDLLSLLTPNDVLVLNNTKVFPARLFGEKTTKGKVEILLLTQTSDTDWTAMHRGKLSVGQEILFGNVSATVTQKHSQTITLSFSIGGNDLREFIWKQGQVPLPPYIHSEESEEENRNTYQTVYAKHTGSVAAPTAGLHFTSELLQKLEEKGIQIEYVTLHVGMGTFLPIKEENVTDHPMHEEHYEIDLDTVKRLNVAKSNGKRIVAVGTTTTRVLESVTDQTGLIDAEKRVGSTAIFIYPPRKYQFVDALITNFHLPHSTLLALIAAFVSEPNTSETFTTFKNSLMGKAYDVAIEHKYHFYSYGDACFIY